jgi:hypothetical protein
LQQELDYRKMMRAHNGDVDNTVVVVRSNKDDDSSSDIDDALYNAAPIFTGTIVTVFSLLLTGYGIYAGLTGDDPLAGHPVR